MACCKTSEVFVDVAVTLYFLQKSRPDSIEKRDIIVTVAGPAANHALMELASLTHSALIL
jgi:hypothetical protein